MKHKMSFYTYIASAVIIYILIFIPAYFIPFHSDDYLFYLRGISLESLYNHYMNWEGRLIGDYTGALLLHFLSRPAYMAINSLVFLILIIQISFVPSVVNQKPVINKSSVILLWLAFFLYWLCNPCLGQTSFWIVGSVIYLWPLMWANFYILCLIKLLHSIIFDTATMTFTKARNAKLSNKEFFLLGCLGFLAGLSNETTGATVVFFTIVLIIIFKYLDGYKQLCRVSSSYSSINDILLTGFFSTLTGFLVLILAPGNFVRLKWIGFADWQNMSLIQRILFHIFDRLPWAISWFWFAFFIIAILLLMFVNTLQSKYKDLKSGCYTVAGLFIVMALFSVAFSMQFQYDCFLFLLPFIIFGVIAYIFYKIFQLRLFVEADSNTIVHYGITLLFFVIAVFSISVLIVSPYVPRRALNTFNFYIILTIIMLVDGIFRRLSDGKKLHYYVGILFLLCLPCFLISYSRFTYAVMQTQIQSAIREDIISETKRRHCENAEIPDWYFTKLSKNTDKFDLFRSDAMPAYYGIKRITWNPAYFNYAILKSKKPLIESLEITDKIKMNLYYDDSCRFFDEPSFVFGFDGLPLLVANNADGKVRFTLLMKDNHSSIDKSVILEDGIRNYTKIGDKYYFVVRLNEIIQVNNIKRVDINFLEQETGKVFFAFPVRLKF